MRLYFGSTALLLAVGFACGCVIGAWIGSAVSGFAFGVRLRRNHAARDQMRQHLDEIDREIQRGKP